MLEMLNSASMPLAGLVAEQVLLKISEVAE